MKWTVGLLAAFVFIAGSVQQMRLQSGLHAEWEDDALYHQMLYLVGEGEFPANTVHPKHRPSHVPLILVVLWPLYQLLGGGWMAVHLIKALFIGSGAIAIQLMTARTRHSVAWAAAWLLSPVTWALVTSTFRPLTLAVGPLMFLIWAFSERRFRTYLGLVAFTLLFREDLALTIVPLAAVAWIRGLPRKWIVWTIVPTVGWFLVATRLLLPAILPTDYDTIIFSSNISVAGLLDGTHWLALLALLLPWAGTSLLRWEVVVGGAGVAAIMLHKSGFAANLLHLMAPAAAAVAAAAALESRVGARTLLAALLASWLLVPNVAYEDAANGPADPDDEPMVCRALVPDEVSVAATGQWLPCLTPRAVLYEYGHRDTPFADVDWIVLDSRDRYAGAGDYIRLDAEVLAGQVAVLARSGFAVNDRDGQVVVLKRTRTVSGLTDTLRGLLPRRDAPESMRRGVRSPGEDLQAPAERGKASGHE